MVRATGAASWKKAAYAWAWTSGAMEPTGGTGTGNTCAPSPTPLSFFFYKPRPIRLAVLMMRIHRSVMRTLARPSVSPSLLKGSKLAAPRAVAR